MEYREIGLGTKIELELYDEDGNRLAPVLISQYETYDEESNVAEIHIPFFEGNIYPVHQYTVMDVIFSKENDTYMFKAEAVQRFYHDNLAMLKVKPITPIIRIQRRAFYRMDCVLDVRYRALGDTIPNDDKIKGEFSEVKTKDISGGGICMLIEEKLEKSSFIEAFIQLEPGNEIRFIGEVVRSNTVRKRGRLMYETGIEYKKIENRDREKIIGYIFEVQRERLKKGWLKA
ncbi:MAG: flagellar brake protein [Clostridiaceae bacterium]|nr:flagellar brake protein [Clostridiaceae bacterium]